MASMFGLIILVFRKMNKQIPFKKSSLWTTVTLYGIGGFFHFVAGCQYAHYWNKMGLNSFGGIWWTEMFYISMVAIIAGIDLLYPFLNRMQERFNHIVLRIWPSSSTIY